MSRKRRAGSNPASATYVLSDVLNVAATLRVMSYTSNTLGRVRYKRRNAQLFPVTPLLKPRGRQRLRSFVQFADGEIGVDAQYFIETTACTRGLIGLRPSIGFLR